MCVCVCVCVCKSVVQSCPTLCDPMDCRPPGSFAHVILQTRIQEWVAIFYSTMSGYASVYFNCPQTVSFNWEGTGNLLHHQIKLRILNQYGKSENQERLTQIHLDSSRRQKGKRDCCQYQDSSSS